MNAINNSCGAVAVIFNPEDNPGLFKKDNSYILKKFDLYGKKCALISEGKKISVITGFGDKKEEELLSVVLPSGMEERTNSFILKWYNNCFSLHTEVNLTEEDIENVKQNREEQYNAKTKILNI